MKRIELAAQQRSVLGKKVKRLRNTGLTPANVYGHNINSVALQVDTKTLKRALSQAGETDLINLIVDNTPRLVVVRDMKIDPIKKVLQHVDFYQVTLTEKIKVEVPIEFVGESLEVEKKGGIIVRSMNSVQIECLPEQIPHQIEINMNAMKEFGDTIKVKDISLDQAVRILNDPNQIIAVAAAPRVVEEVAPKPEVPKAEAEAEVVAEAKEAEPKADAKAAESKK